MKTVTALGLIFSVLSISASGAVQATIFHISTNDTFTVPSGKVLIIEQIRWNQDGLVLQHGTSSFMISSLNFSLSGLPPQWSPPNLVLPLKIPEGWTLSGSNASMFPGPDMNADIWVFGLLVDSSDLLASTQNRIDQISLNGNTLSMGVQTSSVRPVQISVEKSTEVDSGWQTEERAVVSPTDKKTRYQVTVPVEGEQAFLRAKVSPLKK